MIEVVKNVYFGVGIIVLAGAIQGGMKGSYASVIAGGILGLLIVTGGSFLAKGDKVTVGLVLGLIGALGVAGKFLPAFKKEPTIWPAGILGFLALATVILTIVGFAKK